MDCPYPWDLHENAMEATGKCVVDMLYDCAEKRVHNRHGTHYNKMFQTREECTDLYFAKVKIKKQFVLRQQSVRRVFSTACAMLCGGWGGRGQPCGRCGRRAADVRVRVRVCEAAPRPPLRPVRRVDAQTCFLDSFLSRLASIVDLVLAASSQGPSSASE